MKSLFKAERGLNKIFALDQVIPDVEHQGIMLYIIRLARESDVRILLRIRKPRPLGAVVYLSLEEK